MFSFFYFFSVTAHLQFSAKSEQASIQKFLNKRPGHLIVYLR